MNWLVMYARRAHRVCRQPTQSCLCVSRHRLQYDLPAHCAPLLLPTQRGQLGTVHSAFWRQKWQQMPAGRGTKWAHGHQPMNLVPSIVVRAASVDNRDKTNKKVRCASRAHGLNSRLC